MTDTPLSPTEFEAALRAKGAYYHIYHPYHVAMYEGRATREQIQGWVANRFYYQVNIPLKDAAILANCPDREIRREWIQRLLDHDGAPGEDGGIEAWLRLGQAVGLDPDQLRSQELVLPGVRFAVDAYVNFARRASWQEAASSSLTELFAPQIHQSRSITRGSTRPATNTSAPVSVRRGVMSSMDWRSPLSTTRPAKARSACWKFSSSNWIFFGACSMP